MNQSLVIETFNKGDGSVNYVCKELGNIGWRSVEKILTDNGIKYKNPRVVIDSTVKKAIGKLIEGGKSYSQISETLGLKYVTLYKYCKNNNISPKKSIDRVDHSLYLEEITKLADNGESVTFISKKIGLSRATIAKICSKNHITVNSKESLKLDVDYIKKVVEDGGYRFLETVKKHNKNTVRAIHLECGNVRETYFRDFGKFKCKHCNYTGTSKGEEEVVSWIKSIGLSSKKITINRKEIDIYVENNGRKVGIEYCGVYWHSERFNQDKSYHYKKMKLCQENGIRLITIFEDDWKDRELQVKNFLKSVLGVNDRRIYARKCQIKETPSSIAKIFLEENHIQGKTTLKIAFGLYYEDELLGLVTGNRHHRNVGKNSLVLNRLVFKDGCQIVGGASKLLKSLLSYAKTNNYSSLISWSDNRWSEGNVYEKTGFELTMEYTPDYSYSLGASKRASKQANTKKKLLSKGAEGDMQNTERELALTLGLYRIWDCGKKKWEIKL